MRVSRIMEMVKGILGSDAPAPEPVVYYGHYEALWPHRFQGTEDSAWFCCKCGVNNANYPSREDARDAGAEHVREEHEEEAGAFTYEYLRYVPESTP